MTLGETEAPKRRVSDETADRAEVRKALTSIVRQLHDLRRESALLTALLVRTNADPTSNVRAAALCSGVEAASATFDDAVATLNPRQQGHSRVHDLRKALDQLRASIPRP